MLMTLMTRGNAQRAPNYACLALLNASFLNIPTVYNLLVIYKRDNGDEAC